MIRMVCVEGERVKVSHIRYRVKAAPFEAGVRVRVFGQDFNLLMRSYAIRTKQNL